MSQRMPATIETDKIYKAVIIRGEDVQLNPDQADTITAYMLSGESGRVVRLADQDITLRIGDVRRVLRDYDAEAAVRAAKREYQEKQSKMLSPLGAVNSKCRGQYSIQREINNLIQAEHPLDWNDFIGDKPTREAYRQTLLTTDAEWCDYKTGKCACEARA